MQAAEVAKTAAKGLTEVQYLIDGSESSSNNEEEFDESATEDEKYDENEKLKKSALDKLEKASEDSFLGQASYSFGFEFLLYLLEVQFN